MEHLWKRWKQSTKVILISVKDDQLDGRILESLNEKLGRKIIKRQREDHTEIKMWLFYPGDFGIANLRLAWAPGTKIRARLLKASIGVQLSPFSYEGRLGGANQPLWRSSNNGRRRLLRAIRG
jgi:hypothetical protein